MKHAIVAFVVACTVLGACASRQQPAETPPAAQPEAPARAWSGPMLAELRAVAEAAPEQGLAPEREAIEALDRLDRLSVRDVAAAGRLDAAADALFHRLALAFATGAVDLAQTDADWRIPRAPAPDEGALREAVAAGASPGATLRALLPGSLDYNSLVAELARVSAETAGARNETGLSREVRIERLRANLERLRWLPRAWPTRRIEVFVPFFELRVRENEAPIATHAIIVGARRTPTLTFVAAIQSITLNPSWTPPASIANGELLPRFRRDPGAVAREGFDVVDAEGRVVDPAAVDWSARPFPYALRQRPGAGNALGRVRFDMPNRYAIFLHDTPSRNLFARAERALSHGCIRVAEPVALAETVLANAAWDVAGLEAAIAEGGTRNVPLDEPLSVYVLYLTAAADEAGAVQYAEDIYGLDGRLVRALEAVREPRPELSPGVIASTCGAAAGGNARAR